MGKYQIEEVSEETDRVATEIVDAALKVHQALGPGLLESVYETCLTHELTKRGLRCARQVPVDICYDDIRIEAGLRIDLLVEGSVVVELKAVTEMKSLFEAQLLTYIKLSGNRLGLLINFNTTLLKQGLKRMAI